MVRFALVPDFMTRSAARATLAIVVATVGAVVITAALAMWSNTGRAILGTRLEDFVTRTIPGSMTVGELESIGFFRPVAIDVAFYAPDGTRVIYARRVEVDWSVSDLLDGRIGFDMARVDGGELILELSPSKGLSLARTFSARGADGGGEGVKLELREMHVEGVRVVLRLSGEDRFVVKDTQGFVSVWRRDTPGVRVTLNRVEGIFAQPQILGESIELRRLDGEVWGKEHHVVSMQLQTRIADGGINASVDYYDRKDEPVVLQLRPETGSGARLTAFALGVRSWFSEKLDVEIERPREQSDPGAGPGAGAE